MQNPDFYFITGEFKNPQPIACKVLKKIETFNPDASAILVQVHPDWKIGTSKNLNQVILATSPCNKLFPQPANYPAPVTMYHLLVPLNSFELLEKDHVEIIDKGDLFKCVEDIPDVYYE